MTLSWQFHPGNVNFMPMKNIKSIPSKHIGLYLESVVELKESLSVTKSGKDFAVLVSHEEYQNYLDIKKSTEGDSYLLLASKMHNQN